LGRLQSNSNFTADYFLRIFRKSYPEAKHLKTYARHESGAADVGWLALLCAAWDDEALPFADEGEEDEEDDDTGADALEDGKAADDERTTRGTAAALEVAAGEMENWRPHGSSLAE
jgi:hypothetical protein